MTDIIQSSATTTMYRHISATSKHRNITRAVRSITYNNIVNRNSKNSYVNKRVCSSIINHSIASINNNRHQHTRSSTTQQHDSNDNLSSIQLPSLPDYITETSDNLYIDHRLRVKYNTVLIANRGEIACRIIRTCKQLGIRTVTVHSSIDARSQHVLMSDISYNIGDNAARDSYLRGDKIIEVAKLSGAQAIHPGYGFLSENANFANQCFDNNIDFIGPPSKAIIAMGSKSESKNIMLAAGVPCIPGYHGEDQSLDVLRSEADKIGYPLMIKAVSGGGGKGMRIVYNSNEFDEQLESCTREAMNSFKDDRVLLERYIQRPRHIEFQIFADQHGNAVHLYERDCSVQRRHQKVLEEAPAPGMSDELRARMGEAAVNAALAVGYVGAGTVEFIFDSDAADQAIATGETPDNCYYFMEMNTRLQVEHPVTEMIVRRDLVQLQLYVASGYKLPFNQDDIIKQQPYGHAIEARIYAEQPRNNFLPVTGKLHYISTPEPSSYVRVESGVVSGDSVSIYYDPMIAKLIVWGNNRTQALQRMRVALAQYHIVGPSTNIQFVLNCVNNDEFIKGQVDTGFIAKNINTLISDDNVDYNTSAVIGAMYLLHQQKNYNNNTHNNNNTPFYAYNNYRVNQPYIRQRSVTLQLNNDSKTPIQLQITQQNDTDYTVTINGKTYNVILPVKRINNANDNAQFSLSIDSVLYHSSIVVVDNEVNIFNNSTSTHHVLQLPVRNYVRSEGVLGGPISPMAGKVVKVNVRNGQTVTKGQSLVVMEAMKMEHVIRAPHDGVVTKVLYTTGDFVEGGKLLCQIDVEKKP